MLVSARNLRKGKTCSCRIVESVKGSACFKAHGRNENTKTAKEKTCFLSRRFLYFPRMHGIRWAAVSRQPVGRQQGCVEINTMGYFLSMILPGASGCTGKLFVKEEVPYPEEGSRDACPLWGAGVKPRMVPPVALRFIRQKGQKLIGAGDEGLQILGFQGTGGKPCNIEHLPADEMGGFFVFHGGQGTDGGAETIEH